MSLRLGDIAPDFEQDSSDGSIHFYEFLGFICCSNSIELCMICQSQQNLNEIHCL